MRNVSLLLENENEKPTKNVINTTETNHIKNTLFKVGCYFFSILQFWPPNTLNMLVKKTKKN